MAPLPTLIVRVRGAPIEFEGLCWAGPTGALDIQVSVTHYDVRGLDYPSLVRSVRANGPKGFHGLAKWNVAFDHSMEPRGGDCAISAVRVRVTGEILMHAGLTLPRRLSTSSAAGAITTPRCNDTKTDISSMGAS